MKKQDKPKSKLDNMISKRDSLAAQPKINRSHQKVLNFLGAPYGQILKKSLTNQAKRDSIEAVGMLPSIKKELVNIKPSKPVTAKLKQDNTKVLKPMVKKIVKSQVLVKKKK